MAAYAWTPSALTWLHVNHLINGLHKQISWKTVYMPIICILRYILMSKNQALQILCLKHHA